MSEETRDGIHLILLAHRIGELDVVEASGLLESVLESQELHAQCQDFRRQRRRYEARKLAGV